MKAMKAVLGLLAVGVFAGCTAETGDSGSSNGGGATGTAQVFIVAEETVQGGLVAGTGEEDLRDGWNVSYDKFLVTVGNFRASRSSNPGDVRRISDVVVLDLAAIPESGVLLGELTGLAAAQWDRVGYDIANASSSATRHSTVTQADYDVMVSNRYSVYFEATLTKDMGGTMVTHRIPGWGVSAGTSFDDCASDTGDTGFSVTAGGSVQVQPTIHGDHWFFTNITQGAEITERRAQWVVDSDANDDGQTTLAELQAAVAADVFPSSQYNLTGGLEPINTALDFVRAQARTLGDFNGEGECPTRAILP